MPAVKASKVKKSKKVAKASKIKKSTKAANESTRFWLDERSYYRLGNRASSASLDSVLNLYTIKNTISNFVRITSKKSVKVIYAGSQSMVDKYKTVTISANLDDFDKVVGLSLHESSHISFSVLEIYEKLYYFVNEAATNKKFPACHLEDYKKLLVKYFAIVKDDYTLAFNLYFIVKDLINWIEDRRIDDLQTTAFPGYTQYYEKLYSHYFYSDTISKGLKSELYRTATFDSYRFRLLNSMNDASDPKALPNLDKMIDMISIENISACKDNFASADLALDVFALIFKECKNNIENSSAKSSSDVEAEQQKSSGSSSSSSKNEDSKEDEDEGSETESSSSSKSDKNENEEDDEDENEGSSSGDDDEDSDEDNDEDEDANGSGSEDEEDEMTDVEKEWLRSDIIKKMREIEDLLDQKDEKNKEAVEEKVGKTISLLDSGDINILKPVDVATIGNVLSINSISEDVIQVFGNLFEGRYGSSVQKEFVYRGIAKGKILGKKLQIMNDEKIISTIRKENGSIDQRLLPEIGFGNARIFSSRTVENYNKLYVYLTLDSSGSMSGHDWNVTLESTAAIVTALSYVEGARVVVSTRATVNVNAIENAFNMVIYDSKVNNANHIRKYWHRIRATGNTPEGFVFDALMKRILADANGTDAFFINFSDGSPSCGAYNWETKSVGRYGTHEAVEHTRKQVEKLVKSNITVISYYISEVISPNQYFDRMYGKYAHYIEVSDMNKLAHTLNKRFMNRNRITR